MEWIDVVIYCGVIPFIVSFVFIIFLNINDPYLEYIKKLNEKDKEFLRRNNYLN